MQAQLMLNKVSQNVGSPPARHCCTCENCRYGYHAPAKYCYAHGKRLIERAGVNPHKHTSPCSYCSCDKWCGC